MDYIDKIIVSTNPTDEAIDILQKIDLRLEEAMDLLDVVKGEESVDVAKIILKSIKNDIIRRWLWIKKF